MRRKDQKNLLPEFSLAREHGFEIKTSAIKDGNGNSHKRQVLDRLIRKFHFSCKKFLNRNPTLQDYQISL